MRSIILSLLALIGMNLWAQTDVQFQAHVPFNATEVSFSAYIADSSFDEGSRLNSTALWYIEGKGVAVNNSMINVLLEGIPDSIFANNYGKIYLYSYVNGTPMGKLPFHKMPYALFANYTDLAGRSEVASYAQDAKFAEYADTATYASNSGTSVLSDTSTYSHSSGRAVIANTVDTNGVATYSIQDGAVATDKIADSAIVSSKLADNVIENRHVSDDAIGLENLAGNQSAPVGSYVTKGVNGIAWETNPHHKTASVEIYTFAPGQLPNTARWVVSRVAVDYSLAPVVNPVSGQLVTIYNGSTGNNVIIDPLRWNIDTGLTCWVYAGQSRTLWYNGTNWVVIQ